MHPGESHPHERFVLLTAGFGEGHNTAARNLCCAFQRSLPPAECEVVDLFAEVIPKTNYFLRKGYEIAITRFPAIWKLAYRFGASAPGSPFRHNQLVDALQRRLIGLSPASVACTHPFYHELIHKVRLRPASPAFPLVTVVTDSISIHPLWLRHAGERICVADQRSAEIMRAKGLPEERLAVTGFPVHPVFTELTPVSPPGKDGGPARVLFLPSTTRGHVTRTLTHLMETMPRTPLALTVVLGRHETRLGSLVRSLVADTPQIEVHGWTDRMPEFLSSHHLVITKAGGATINEAIAARCPLILNYVVPGQEEGNAERVETEGLGAVISSPAALAEYVEKILREPGLTTWLAWRRRLEKIAKPGAALTIAGEIRDAGRRLFNGAGALARELLPPSGGQECPPHE